MPRHHRKCLLACLFAKNKKMMNFYYHSSRRRIRYEWRQQRRCANDEGKKPESMNGYFGNINQTNNLEFKLGIRWNLHAHLWVTLWVRNYRAREKTKCFLSIELSSQLSSSRVKLRDLSFKLLNGNMRWFEIPFSSFHNKNSRESPLKTFLGLYAGNKLRKCFEFDMEILKNFPSITRSFRLD